MKAGDRVEHTLIDLKGTIVSDDGNYVVVKWDDDGKTGILYWDRNMVPSAYRLVPLKVAHGH